MRETSAGCRGIPLVRWRCRLRVQGLWRVQRRVGNHPTRDHATVT